ncbi:PilZ domain-containing protein [Roseospira visakhapatnamensis]|uniref:PilZ domain-containing protein n=1 Tax=Roseospira visakhapatnamensis TaxID=390880 RepID=A0A7W6RAI7_9PROT|nr:PilZ domain-containing protein [Roseospira visakhapatnamensis]MBB4264556.1 hypothetical protein [Roseospira visakhapatnamensis]
MEPPQTPDMMDRSAVAGGERRRHGPRRPLPLSGRWMAGGRWVHVLVENISLHGAALNLGAPLAPDDRGVLTLEGLDVPIPCVVCWSTGAVAGVRFVLDAAVTEALSAHIDRYAAKASLPMSWATGPADPPR